MIAKAAILTYHSIDNSGSVISMAVDKFRFQMETLKKRNFDVISLKELVSCLRGKHPLNPKSVVITFDDGFKNFYSLAYPVLTEFGYPATVFLVPGHCGKKNNWNGQPANIAFLDLLDWHEIREMCNNGIEFAAHTMSHPNLLHVPIDNAAREIIESKATIQKYLAKEVQFFSYPYGKSNEKIKSVVKNEFEGACSTELGLVNLDADIYSLPRIDMYYFSKNNLFAWYGSSIFWLYILVRSTMRSFRSKTFYR